MVTSPAWLVMNGSTAACTIAPAITASAALPPLFSTFMIVSVTIALSVVTAAFRSEEHTSELQSLMRISYAVFCLKKKKNKSHHSDLLINEYRYISNLQHRP